MVIQARKRFVVAFVVALFLALFAAVTQAQVLIPSGCKDLTPSDWEWWIRQCYLYTVSEEATQPAVHGFLVR